MAPTILNSVGTEMSLQNTLFVAGKELGMHLYTFVLCSQWRWLAIPLEGVCHGQAALHGSGNCPGGI